jgi:hypothetical protein
MSFVVPSGVSTRDAGKTLGMSPHLHEVPGGPPSSFAGRASRPLASGQSRQWQIDRGIKLPAEHAEPAFALAQIAPHSAGTEKLLGPAPQATSGVAASSPTAKSVSFAS